MYSGYVKNNFISHLTVELLDFLLFAASTDEEKATEDVFCDCSLPPPEAMSANSEILSVETDLERGL